VASLEARQRARQQGGRAGKCPPPPASPPFGHSRRGVQLRGAPRLRMPSSDATLRFDEMDTNGDGVITRDEWNTGSPPPPPRLPVLACTAVGPPSFVCGRSWDVVMHLPPHSD
jgi:hypothetical protein